MDGQWYPKNASSFAAMLTKQNSRLSVHLKMPKSKLQWKLQEQLQQKLHEHPELAEAADSRDQALARHLLQNQTILQTQNQGQAVSDRWSHAQADVRTKGTLRQGQSDSTKGNF